MIKRADILKLGQTIDAAKTILLLQPDNPDGDSLGSMLALEDILGELGKQTIMYTAGRIEPYLFHQTGHDRVQTGDDWPTHWDLAILVDTAAPDQIARLLGAHHRELNNKPWVVIDHHGSRTPIEGISQELIEPTASATSEILYRIAKTLKWPLTQTACERLLASLFADTLNLTTPSVTVETAQVYAALVKQGNVNVSELHKAFRETSAYDPDLIKVKGELLASMELYANNQAAIIFVPREIVKEYRERTSLASLVLYDMLWARGVKVAAVMSDYGTVIRTSLRSRVPVAGPVATKLGGGGHAMAAAFSREGIPVEEAKEQLILELSAALREI